MVQNGIIINGVVYEAYETEDFRCENCELCNGNTECEIGADLCLELDAKLGINIHLRKLNSIE